MSPKPTKRDIASFGGTRSVSMPKTGCNWNDGTAEPKPSSGNRIYVRYNNQIPDSGHGLIESVSTAVCGAILVTGARDIIACASASAALSTSPGVLRQRRADRSLRNRETSYIRLLRACLSQFLLKEPIPPKNLLYVSPFSLASYLTKASSIVQR